MRSDIQALVNEQGYKTHEEVEDNIWQLIHTTKRCDRDHKARLENLLSLHLLEHTSKHASQLWRGGQTLITSSRRMTSSAPLIAEKEQGSQIEMTIRSNKTRGLSERRS